MKNFSYETVGNSSYLVRTFDGGRGLINYQLQMLVNNDIRNIIKASKRQRNDDIVVSYNITSHISLAQFDSKNKIPKEGIIKIIEGAINALEDIVEYQLVSSGIVFDEDYIFVKPGSFEPGFIYVPISTEDNGIKPLKNFIFSLIMSSKLEMSNDNFIQVLLETLNNPALTAADLKKLCEDANKPQANRVESKKETPIRREPEVKIPTQEKQQVPQNVVPEIKREPVSISNIPTSIQKAIPEDKKVKNNKAEKKDKTASNGNKTKFIIFQVVFIALIAVIAFSGILNNEAGQLEVTYLAGILLGVACADFILYREMFVNNKNKEEKSESIDKSEKNKKAPNKPMVSMPGKDKPGMPNIPGKSANIPSAAPKANVPIRKEEKVESEVIQQPVAPVVSNSVPQAAYVPPAQSYNPPISDFESEDTVVLDDDTSGEAYLEYFENGLSTKIKLNKESIIVGKLRGQCDFALNNNKISKMHAEFIVRNGEYFVKDYNSTNGTYINGSNQRIQSNVEYPIFNGDRITLANVDLTFRC